MKKFAFLLVALALSSPVIAEPLPALDSGQDEVMADEAQQTLDEAAPAAAGLCNLAALAFLNQNFNVLANAQAKCNALLQQTPAGACNVIKRGKKFQAQFRLNFQQNQQALGTLLQGLVTFLTTNNVFATNALKLQTAVSNGCG
jgi:hypothetical protein